MPLEWANEKEWDELWRKTLQVTSKTQDEVLNTFGYFVAKDAVKFTYGEPAAKIKADLAQPSRKYPRADVADVLTRKQFRNLTPKQLKEFKKKFIASRVARKNFVRVWGIAAMRVLQPYVDKDYKGSNGGKVSGVRMKGKPKGGAIPAEGGWDLHSEVTIYSTVKEDKMPADVVKYSEQGLNEAIQNQVNDKLKYIDDKMQKAMDQTINQDH